MVESLETSSTVPSVIELFQHLPAQVILGPIDLPKIDFELWQVFTELFVLKCLKIDSPLSMIPEKKKKSIGQPVFCTLFKCSW
jgi:hypothetical protein